MTDRMLVVESIDYPWVTPPKHYNAFSKVLIDPVSVPGAPFDFRISRYPIGGRVDPHIHETATQLYYVISGSGLATSGEERHRIGPGTTLYMPPGVDHAIENTGTEDLVFAIVTTEPPVVA